MNHILFNNISNINNFVFSIVPCTMSPYTGNAFRSIPLPNSMIFLLTEFVHNKLSGWCSMNAEFMSMILRLLNIENRMFNYGIAGSLTHATVIVKMGSNEYLFDPYFNKHYSMNGKPLTFNDLILLIKSGDTDNIVSIYGASLKYYNLPDREGYFDGEAYENCVINDHINKKKLNEVLIDHFGNTNLFNLMTVTI